ncbi:MAG: nicotinate phosphoribosyltransferase [Candidatus Omnitrophica bacterium]|nr:nicotinate phosphoribosyltransferase [Candidatus Omnitrophota bacterium]
MGILRRLYRDNLGLATDLYQMTMAYGYWKSGVCEKEAVFNLFFRQNPFNSGFTLAAGLTYLLDYLEDFHFDDSDLEYLGGITGQDGRPLFEPAFLDFLHGLRLTLDLEAVPEGTVVFPHEPLVRVQGPLIQCQILETPLINIINFQSLIATKAARVCQAAQGEPVIEFGLRRAHGLDGGVAASWAAYIGGCAGSSNLLAGKLFGIPVKGTHAHSWVMSFNSEQEAFVAYARNLPNNCVFLVDTYDTLAGVRQAVETGRWLREHGHSLLGIRLDSGDLAYLSIEARKILDAAGFQDAKILASNDLDEHIILSLKEQGAKIGVWGVGTRLVTAFDHPTLGVVYKMSALRSAGGPWQYKIKLSDQAAKVTDPGILQVRRFYQASGFLADMIYDLPLGIGKEARIIDPEDMTRRKRVPEGTAYTELLVPVMRAGRLVYQSPPAHLIKQYAIEQQQQLHPGIKRFVNPHRYPAGLESGLHELKMRLILEARNGRTPAAAT